MAKSKPTEILVELVDLLTPLTPEERKRVIHAALTMLGDDPEAAKHAGLSTPGSREENTLDLPRRVAQWLKQNELSADELSEVFHIADGQAELIASDLPGKNAKEQTLNAYVLTGVAAFLASGDTKFDDKSARATCKAAGCLNNSNHALYLKGKGNEFTGSKGSGWTLTAPGLKRGAILIKEITKKG